MEQCLSCAFVSELFSLFLCYICMAAVEYMKKLSVYGETDLFFPIN